jgi:lysophospholipase L1-like esterase
LAESAPSDLDVVILGDSITEHLAGTELGQVEETWERHSAVFNRLFTKHGGGDVEGLALGIGGDACAQLLYRLQNGELTPTLRPKVWWILIGTYDLTNDCSAEATLMGVVAVVEEMLWQRPNDIIVINSILPRPRNKMGSLRGKLWIKTDWINQRLECFAKGYSNWNTMMRLIYFSIKIIPRQSRIIMPMIGYILLRLGHRNGEKPLSKRSRNSFMINEHDVLTSRL